MSVVVFHSMVAPFVQQPARAFHEAGLLDSFCTSLVHDPASWRQTLACRLSAAVRFDLRRQLQRRAVNEVPLTYLRRHPWGELLRLAAARIDNSERLGDLVWERTEHGFDRHIARHHLGAAVTAVYGFEHSSLATFQAAKLSGRAVIYDVPAPEPDFVQHMLERELAVVPELRTPFFEHTFAREQRRADRRRAEWELADVVIAASKFTRNTFAQAGRDVSKVRIVPYGAPPVADREQALRGGTRAGPMRFLWAGTFGARKGAHYLLEAWKQGRFGRFARLDIFGAMGLPARLVNPLPEGVTYHGSIPRSQLMDEYQRSDALLFPTLCDGFGMVATEAWSRGVPVITTECAGCTDLLTPGGNGRIVRAADISSLVEEIAWCLEHRSELEAMRSAALTTAAAWQWSDYRRALVAAVGPVIGRTP